MDFNDNSFLIKRIQKDDTEAFAFLVNTYHHRLCVYANSLVKNSMLAEDIVQNTFIKLWKKREKLNTNHSIKSFLYKSTYNEFIDQYRKSQSVLRIEKLYLEHLNTLVLNEEENENTQKLIRLVKQLMDELPPKCKQVFVLSKKEGLTNIEISEHLEISVKAVESQITRGFKILRKKLAEKVKPILLILLGGRYGLSKK